MKKKPLKVLSKQECDALMHELSLYGNTDRCKRNAVRNSCMAALMLDAGLRVGEVVKLPRRSLCFAGEPVQAVCVPADIAKTRVERTIPTSENLNWHIQQMRLFVWGDGIRPEYLVAFYGHSPRRAITIRRVQYIIARAGIKSIGRAITPHQLRHTFATRLMGVCSTRVIQHLLGHAALSSTQIYTHPNSLDLVSAIRMMERKDNGKS